MTDTASFFASSNTLRRRPRWGATTSTGLVRSVVRYSRMSPLADSSLATTTTGATSSGCA